MIFSEVYVMRLKSILLFSFAGLFFSPIPASAQLVLEVDAWSDGADVVPGDGVCLSVDGVCSFRAAIEEANAHPNSGGPDVIQFTNIPILVWLAVIEVQNIELPRITDRVIIDATTAAGDVIIDGSSVITLSSNGIFLGYGANGNVVKGLSIINFAGTGIVIQSDGNHIKDNYIGILSDGSNEGNGSYGIYVQDGNDNVIGDAGHGNVIGNNGEDGIYISIGDNNKVRGNYVGTDAEGRRAGNTYSGIIVASGEGNIIGGINPELGNTVGFNGTIGIQVGYGIDNEIRNNYVGTDAEGRNLGNVSYGILVNHEEGSMVGGISDYGNVVGWNAQGVVVEYSTNVKVQGNFIGVTPAGHAAGNLGPGVRIWGIDVFSTRVGYGVNANIPADPRKGNRIANNDGPGVALQTAYYPETSVMENSIRGNAIYDNAGPGIDLGEDGVTANDAHDSDLRPNHLMNHPDIVLVGYNGSFDVVAVEYSLSSDDTIVSYPLTVDVYLSDGAGEGKTYIGTDTYSTPNTISRFDVDANSINWLSTDRLVLTATDADGNTSEFSPASEEIGGPGNPIAAVGTRDVLRIGEEQPATFSLSLPYPNPFSPQTTFNLDLPEPGNIRITVHDALGRQVVTLHNGQLSAQSHTFTLDASHLASGIYLLRVAGDGFVGTRRLVLVK